MKTNSFNSYIKLKTTGFILVDTSSYNGIANFSPLLLLYKLEGQ